MMERNMLVNTKMIRNMELENITGVQISGMMENGTIVNNMDVV
jgi:hypothetical protein